LEGGHEIESSVLKFRRQCHLVLLIDICIGSELIVIALKRLRYGDIYCNYARATLEAKLLILLLERLHVKSTCNWVFGYQHNNCSRTEETSAKP
jgi:hypothetical protein